jgi:uncharacterized protein (TIGR02466 family)
MADIRHLFATPVALEMVTESVDLEALRRAILAERERDPEGAARSNWGGWHSADTLQHWGGDAARRLAARAAALADAMTFNAAEPQATSQNWLVDMWANVAAAGHHHQYHVHPGCVWSAVAYIDDGYDGDADPTLGGELTLLDPRMPTLRMAAPHLHLREGEGEQPIEPAIRPRTGLMVVFPAWLQHAVRPFRGPGTRISVALNLKSA